jgi:hypothetical protein
MRIDGQDSPAWLAAAAAAFALTAGLAADNGGFDPLSWDRALVGVAALALVLAIVAVARRPGPHALAMLAALALLTAWTAASWLWSESPPRALVEAQRVALYLGIATAVVLARPPVRAIAAGVVAGATLVAAWNVVVHIHGTSHPHETGVLDDPVGYANALGALCVVGLLLLPALPRLALVAAPVLGADFVLQASSGAAAALAAGAATYVFLVRPRLRVALVVLAIAGAVLSPFALRAHERTDYWHVAVREAEAKPALGTGAGTFANWWVRGRTVPQQTREAHSLYLETLAELGPLGLAFLLVALSAPLVAAARSRQPAVAAALVAYDVAAAVDFHWELAGVTAPVVLIGGAAAARAARSRPLPRLAAVPALAALTAAAVLAYGGSARLSSAQDALRRGDRARAAADARSALRLAPFSSDAWSVLGVAEQSPAAYREALSLDRNDWSLWLGLANVSHGETRRHALREAARLDPLLNAR